MGKPRPVRWNIDLLRLLSRVSGKHPQTIRTEVGFLSCVVGIRLPNNHNNGCVSAETIVKQ